MHMTKAGIAKLLRTVGQDMKKQWGSIFVMFLISWAIRYRFEFDWRDPWHDWVFIGFGWMGVAMHTFGYHMEKRTRRVLRGIGIAAGIAWFLYVYLIVRNGQGSMSGLS